MSLSNSDVGPAIELDVLAVLIEKVGTEFPACSA